jgi:polysaccharide export outer membrane protein
LQALGEVGGIAPGGDLKRILLFREQNGKRSMHIIDLTNGDFFNSPNYYLKQNDVVYVSPTERQLLASDQSAMRTFQYVNIGFGIVNLLTFLILNLLR